MNSEKQPGISFKQIILRELLFSRMPEINDDRVLKFDFEYKSSLSEDKNGLVAELSCVITDEKKSFDLKCSMIGVFESMKGNENLELENFAEYNAPALIFPYLRELVSSTTLKAGLPIIMFPPMNIFAMIKADKERVKD